MATQAELEALVEAAKAGRARPLILLYGDQDYLVKQAYDRLLQALVPESLRAFNLEQFDGARSSAQEVCDAFNTLPLMPGPKAVGVVDARFFQSKGSAAALLEKAKVRWEQGEPSTALRQLGQVLVLASLNWESAQGLSLVELGAELDSDVLNDEKHGGAWLALALAQGLASQFPMPPSADEAELLQSALEQALAGPQEGIHQYLVCACPAADMRKRLSKLFHEKGHALDFKLETRGAQASQTARAFLSNLMKQHGVSMRANLGERLVAAYGYDLGLLERELEKMRDHAWPRTALEEADLLAVGGPRPEEDVFKFLDALGKRDLGESLRLLRQQLRHEPAQALMGRLNVELRRLVFCRALVDEGWIPGRGSDYNSFKAGLYAKLGRELPVHLAAQWKKTSAYPLFQALQRCRVFEPAELKLLLGQLMSMDMRLKVSGISAEEALEEVCLRLCGAHEEVFL